jgi:aminoglycoside 2'-N-acetyltransferase I
MMNHMIEVRTAHTADLTAGTLRAARAVLDEAFDGDFTDDDWDHCLGGMHALAWQDGELAAHGAVTQRRLLYPGRALRAGYVEGIGVRPGLQRRGYGAAVMGALERVVRAAHDVGALSAREGAAPFYAARGWQLWQGPLSALTPAGISRTADDEGGMYVLDCGGNLDLAAGLTCDWRDGDVW